MMNPEAFSIGVLHIRWYGLMASCGVLSAYFLLMKRRDKYGFSSDDISDILFWAMIGALVGARLLYVYRFWNEQFAGHFMDVFKIYEGGLVFLGGFAVSACVLLLMCHFRHWSLGNLSDLAAPVLPLGHAFGRIGCFLNGCCHGFRYQGVGCIRYARPDWPTFPLQLISAMANLLLAGLLLWLEKKGKLRHSLFLLYLLLYSVGRFCLEFGRGDYPEDQLWHGLTPAQVTCLWMAPLTVVVWAIIALRRKYAGK